MYPVLDLAELLEQVRSLYGQLEEPSGPNTQAIGQVKLDPDDFCIVRLVLAGDLTAEAGGQNEQAIALFDSVREAQESCVWETPGMKSTIFLALALYRSFMVEEQCSLNGLTVNLSLTNR